MPQAFNVHIQDLLRLTREMMVLADLGDRDRTDPSCGVLYGSLRDAAYKLRGDAEQERSRHMQRGIWDLHDDKEQFNTDPGHSVKE
jgi:hypothetical protein